MRLNLLFFVLIPAILARKDQSRSSSLCMHAAPGEEAIQVCDHEEGYPCSCEQNSVDCNRMNLKTSFVELVDVVAKIPVRELFLESNEITALYQDQIMPGQIDTLTRIYLRSNLICYIEPGAFGGMNRLQELDLSENRIHTINMETFGNLPSLIQLHLQGNRISNLTGPVFAELRQLKYLFLDDNPIGNIDEETFTDLGNLLELTMDNTGLTAIKENWFKGLNSLQTLTLRKNHFLIAPRIHSIPSLRTLDISGNPIMELNTHAFHGTPHLTELVVAKMPHLWAVEDCAFCGLIHLEQVEMYENKALYYIDPEAFGKHLRKLKVVDFGMCNLTTLPRSLLAWNNLTSLKLSGNPWHCDCSISWMNNIRLPYQEGYPTCKSPSALKGRHIDTIRDEEFHCRSGGLGAGKIFVAVTIVLLIAGTVTLACYFILTRNSQHPFFKSNPFSRISLPKYAYRNLAMDAERDDVLFTRDRNLDQKEDLPPPVQL